MELPVFYMIRCKAINKWVGKKSMSYAVRSDAHIAELDASYPDRDNWQSDAYWWVDDPKKAKAWTELRDLRRLRSLAGGRREEKDTFSQFEVHASDGRVFPLDDV